MTPQLALAKRIPLPPATTTALATASSSAMAAFNEAQSCDNVVAALEVAQGIEELRALFDLPEIRQRIISLQDKAIGFRTDKDPTIWNKKANKFNEPYQWEVVRDCCIEATLRGLQLVGNQMNIITGRMYATKEGYESLIRKLKNVTDYTPNIGVPKSLVGGVLVECEGTWQKDGVPQVLKATIPVKSDDFSSVEQILGKATRKFHKRAYEKMTGSAPSDGDSGETGGTDDVPKPAPAEAEKAPEFKSRKKATPAATAPVEVIVPMPDRQLASSPAPESGGDEPGNGEGNPTDAIGELQAQFRDYCDASQVSFADAAKWLVTTGRFPDGGSIETWSEIPNDVVERLSTAPEELKRLVRLFGKARK